jgi:hypothetical protein
MAENDSTKDYNESVRANLPSGMTYNSDVDRYQINNHSFFKFKNANWYYNYITKYGYTSASAYSVAGFEPSLVFDFEQEFYRTSGTTSTFSDSITHARSGNATMVDSDGLLKWAPHNLVTYSEQFDSAAWTKNGLLPFGSGSVVDATLAPDGTTTADKIVETADSSRSAVFQVRLVSGDVAGSVYVKKAEREHVTVSLSTSGASNWCAIVVNLSSGLVTKTQSSSVSLDDYSVEEAENGFYKITVQSFADTFDTNNCYFWVGIATSDTPTLGAYGQEVYTGDGTSGVYLWGAHLYRSDLGGMVNNPDTGNSYVPTTTAARYLPRRGHHVWNGTEWVNEGLLVESEARTNLLPYSEAFDNGAWGKTGTATLAIDATGPDGETSAVTLVDNGATGTGLVFVDEGVGFTSATTNGVASCFVKAKDLSWVCLAVDNLIDDGFSGTGSRTWFNLSTGSIGQTGSYVTPTIENYGNGWYRCAISLTPPGTDDFGTMRIFVADADGDLTVDLDGTSSIYIYGAQFEVGATPSSYIPTNSGATATRAADTLTIPAANLPWPELVVIEPELVTNGTFDTDTSGWTATRDATLTVDGNNRIEVISGGRLYGKASQIITAEIGKTYKIEVDVTTGTVSGGVTVGTTQDGHNLVGQTAFNGHFVAFFVATASTLYVGMQNNSATTGASAYFDNISVREINPLAVSIQMDGRMTYADTDSNPELQFLDWTESGVGYIKLRMQTSFGSGRFQAQQSNGAVLDSVISGNDYYSPGVLVPFNIASRHGSTFINGAVDGVALTADLTPVALPDLSSTDLNLAFDYMGTVKTFRVWADDLTDENIALASATAPAIIGLPTIGVS